MRKRCHNPNNKRWHRYGGRGITICADWDNYPAFESWAMSNGYADGLSIDRVYINGNYEPANCEWVSSSENTRRGHEWRRRAKVMEALL